MYRNCPLLAIFLFNLIFFLPCILLADGVPNTSSVKEVVKVPAEQIDPRLPPVIPGQQVTAGGKKHVVISTAGPVPVSPVPEAPVPGYSENSASRYEGSNYHSSNYDSGVSGVIVDKRK